MIIALFALAIVMIVGGSASIVQGFPFVRLESGMAMTVAGATIASAGAVLLGLAALALRLRALERMLTTTRLAGTDDLGVRETFGAQANVGTPGPAPDAPFVDPGRQRPSLAVAALGAGATVGGLAGLGALRSGTEPHFTDPIPAAEPDEPVLPNLLPPDAEVAPAEPRAPDFTAVDTAAYVPVAHAPATTDLPDGDALFATLERPPEEAEPEPARQENGAEEVPPPPAEALEEERDRPQQIHAEEVPASDPPALPPSPAQEAEIAEFVEVAEPAAPPSEPEATEPALEVVGTYASGGNTYVMYANGSIAAETPRGRYTFASLDELKAFVEAGGEMDARRGA